MKFIYFLLPILLIISCSSEKKEQKPLMVQIKTLEFTRDNNLTHWKALYKKAKADEKTALINSIAMTKNSDFIPFLDSLLNAEDNAELRGKIIFALGQTGSEKAEALLLSTFNSALPLNFKLDIIKALRHCGTARSVPHLQAWVKEKGLKEQAVITAGILSRKKINVNDFRKTVLNDSLNGCAYFLYNAYNRRDLKRIVEMLSASKDSERKYLLKWLVKDYHRRGRYFASSIAEDSLFNDTMKRVIKSEKDWRNLYYAVQLIPAVNDSSKEEWLDGFIKSSNPHLRLEAYKAMAKINETRIPELISAEKEWALKGELLKLLAKTQPGITYGMVMENLDRGTDDFKIKLLEALNIINDWMSRQTLHQFLHVDNPRLVNAAFDILKKRKRIKDEDFDALINSKAVSSIATALEWKTSLKKSLPPDLLMGLYTKFKAPESFDVQTEVLKNLKLNKNKISGKEQINLLYKHAANRRIVEELNQWLSLHNDTLSAFVLPGFLSPDSIVAADDHVIVQIKTHRGNIKMELLPDEAPLTVYNFLLLVKKGFYDGLTFHRVVPDFVIQGGDPQGDGWGGPGYFIPSEDNEAPFQRGSVGIATSGFDTGGCQFFICQSEQPHLDGNYTLFAEVVAGMDVVDRILPDDKIISITVLE